MREILKKIKSRCQFLTSLLRDLEVFSTRLQHCKFVVVSQGRSGSNLLLGLLNSHSQVITYGELFRDADAIGWDRPEYGQDSRSSHLVAMRNKNPQKFLATEVFKEYASSVSAVGFKIFYYHAREGYRKSVWRCLQNQQDIKIIHLKRKNMLRTLLSLKKAFLTDQWILNNQDSITEEPKQVTVSLTYEECVEYFNGTQANMNKHDLFFNKHQKIDVFYEELSEDCERERKRVQEFLELEYEHLKPATVKQSYLPLSQSISNYFELKEKFANTPWAIFFED